MRRRIGLLLITLACGASGCAGPQMAFTREADDSDAFAPEVELAHRPTLAVQACRTPHRALHKRVVQALGDSGQFESVLAPDQASDAALPPPDYVLRVDFETEGGGKVYNLFTCFPGFLFFLPNLVKLRWDYDLWTTLRLESRHGDPQVWKRHDRYHLAYTPDGYTIVNALGWGALLFTPMGALPLGAGIASIFDSPDMWRVQDGFSGSTEGHAFAQGVARGVARAIESAPTGASVAASPRPR